MRRAATWTLASACALLPRATRAQGADSSPSGAPRSCNPIAHVLTIAVRRRDGTPVPDAELFVSDGRSGKVLARRARGSTAGVYLVLGAEETPLVPVNGGVPLRLRVAWGGATRSVRWTLRAPVDACGAVRADGPTLVTLP